MPSRREIVKNAIKLAGAGSLGLGGGALAGPQMGRARTFSHVDAMLRAAAHSGEAPGIVALAANDRDLIYEGAFGSRRLPGGPAMTRDTVFRVASMVKLITSVAALQLVEQGKLSLDAAVPGIDPVLGSPQVLEGFDAKRVPQLRPAKRPIALRHLLTHTAGFTYRLWDAKAVQYANSIVEHVSGEPLELYFRKHILDPLGMRDTGFVLSSEQREREASLHRRGPDGFLKAEPIERQSPHASFSGGGGIYSTASDYLTLIRALLRGGALDSVRILRPETMALMSQNQIGEIEAGVLRTTSPTVSNNVDFFPGISLKWGFGHMINMQPVPGGRSAGSLTWAGLLNTYYWIDPGKRITAVFMTQVLPFADHRALRIYRRFERGVYGVVKAV
jgi:methyl acetate hydrolase